MTNNDIPFFLNCVIQLVSLIYITKVCFIGKCSVIRNAATVIACIILLPTWGMILPIILLNSLLAGTGYVGVIFAFLMMAVVFALLYAFLCVKKNRTLAVFSYLMFYMIGIYGFSLVMNSTDTASSVISQTVIVCVIQFLFCYFILPQIVQLSKEGRVLNKAEFYLLPGMYIIVGFFLIFIPSSSRDPYINTAFAVLLTFIEILVVITFKSILTNLRQINEINDKNEKLEKARDVIKTLSVEVMEALAHTIDAKDEYTSGHSIRVANYSRMIAKRMGLSETECEDVYYMGLLHDLGKIGVPNEIINSPEKLTDEQYDIVKKHPGLGSVILSEIKSRPDLVTGARWHHERFDGKGYPDGKSGEDIPIMARIIAVADSYDAMTSNRSYRGYMPQEKVRSELEKNSGKQFDPKIAECMIGIMDEDKEYTLHE